MEVNRTTQLSVSIDEIHHDTVFTIQRINNSMGSVEHSTKYFLDSSIITEISIIGQQTTRVTDFIGDDLKTYFAFGTDATGVSLGEGWHSYTYSIDTPMGKKDIQRQQSVPAPTCARSFYCLKFSFFALFFQEIIRPDVPWSPARAHGGHCQCYLVHIPTSQPCQHQLRFGVQMQQCLQGVC